MDETYCGGYRRGGKKGRAASAHKTIVAGAVERQGHVIAKVIPDIFTRTLEPFVQEKVLPSSIVYTDEHTSYRNLNSLGYDHRRIHHTQKVYVIGDRHTNSIEGFWSLIKNGIRGTNHSVSAKYLQTYIDSYAFRYNRRFDTEPMFTSILTQARKGQN